MSDTEKKVDEVQKDKVKTAKKHKKSSNGTKKTSSSGAKKSSSNGTKKTSSNGTKKTSSNGTKKASSNKAKKPVHKSELKNKEQVAADLAKTRVIDLEDDYIDFEEEKAKDPKGKESKAKESKAKELKANDMKAKDMEESKAAEEKKAKRKRRKKKAAKILGIIFGVLVIIYVALAVFFDSHFICNTTINGMDVSFKSVQKVDELMEEHVETYVLTLNESDGDTEEIVGADISAEYVAGEGFSKLLKEQNNYFWIKNLWEKQELEAVIDVEYNEIQLAKKIETLACMQEDNKDKSVNAHPEFKDTEFVVVEEVIGTEIDEEKFNAAVREAISTCQDTLEMAEKDCYVYPTYVADSEEVLEATEKMNSYLGAKITYDFNPNTEVVDASVISQWVKCNDKMKVTFDKDAVKKYIDELGDKYDTLCENRKFTTARGDTVTVKGGYYGWKIDQDAEYDHLIKDIKSGEEVNREPEYKTRAVTHGDIDIGDTYAEVDLTNQKVYFTKNGKVVFSSDCVTGNVSAGHATPQGTYSLTYKTRDAVLRGSKNADGEYEYESPVSYWMPFNGGIGFHDATWRSSFGGSIYKTAGSHGCVNMPKSNAAKLYELVEKGIPVVCYY